MNTPKQVFETYLERIEFVSGGTVRPVWTPDGEFLCFMEEGPENAHITRIEISTGKTDLLLDVKAVREALAAATGYEPPHRGLPFHEFHTTQDGRVVFIYEGKRWLIDPATSRLERAPGLDAFSGALGWNPEDEPTPRSWQRYDYLSLVMDVPEQLAPNGEHFAGIRDHNIVLRPTRARHARERPLTTDGTAERFWDIESVRVQLRSGRRVGFRSVNPWSPDSRTLFAYCRDITGVFRVPRLNWLVPFEEIETFAFQKVGARLDRVEPFFVDTRSAQQTRIRLEDIENRYIQFLAWRADAAEAMFIVYTRDFKRVDIYGADRHTGAIREVLTEQSPTFVKNQHESMLYGEHGFRLLPDGSGFLWTSTRDGWNHIYRYDMNGRLLGQLTSGTWPVHDIAHLGTDDFVYFTAAIDEARPYDVHVCRVPLKGGEIQRLTRESGVHCPDFAPGGRAFLDTHSSVDRPTRTELLKTDGTRLRMLSQMDVSRLEAVGYRAPEEFTVKAADGITDVWGVMYKPYDFDPDSSYPVIEYIYGGPQTVEAPHFFAIDRSMMSTMQLPWALAHLGYVVVCVDARGTPGRSKAFHDAVCDDFTIGLEDHAAAIRELCRRNPWMDADRVGITGHSWGGYFSTMALIQAPDTYHAAVSYAPAYDPRDALYYEPYLGVKDNPAYERADPIRQAAGIKGRLMIVAGTSDAYSFTPAMRMTWALIEAGVDHEFVVVPQAFHQFIGAEDRYLMMKLTGWFDRYLKQRTVASQAAR